MLRVEDNRIGFVRIRGFSLGLIHWNVSMASDRSPALRSPNESSPIFHCLGYSPRNITPGQMKSRRLKTRHPGNRLMLHLNSKGGRQIATHFSVWTARPRRIRARLHSERLVAIVSRRTTLPSRRFWPVRTLITVSLTRISTVRS